MKTKKLRKINLLKTFNLKEVRRQLIVVFALAFFVGANLLLANFSWRLDLSSGKAYTLSTATKKIVKKLDKALTIEFFVSSDLPTKLLSAKSEVIDLLNEYKKENGKVQVKILDPKKDDKALTKAKENNIPELQFSQLESDKYAVSTAYFGILLSYGDKKDSLPQISDLENLEYNLTALIYKLTNNELAKIGLVNDTGLNSIFNGVVSQQFSAAAVDLKNINTDAKTLLVVDDNQKEFNDEEIIGLKKYLEDGGKAIFLTDGTWVSDKLTAEKPKTNLENVFVDWGIKLNNDLILSTSAEIVNFGGNDLSYLSTYPFWLKANNFDKKSSYFSNINQVMLPWVSSLSLDKNATALIKTTPKSWQQKDSFSLLPNSIPQPQSKDLKEFVVAAESKKPNGGQIVVIASSRFLQDRYQSRTSGNMEMVYNALNDLASGGALSGIRQRAIIYYPLPELAENQKDLFKYLNILIFPGLLALFGAYRLIKRK